MNGMQENQGKVRIGWGGDRVNLFFPFPSLSLPFFFLSFHVSSSHNEGGGGGGCNYNAVSVEIIISVLIPETRQGSMTGLT